MKGDFFYHKASNRIFPLDLLKSAGLTSGPEPGTSGLEKTAPSGELEFFSRSI